MPVNNEFGAKIRGLREIRNISAEDLSQRCGLTVEEIETIENGTLLPSLTPLLKISRGLGVRLGTFLDDSETCAPVVSRSAEHSRTVRFAGSCDKNGLEFQSLAANKTDRNMEPFIIDVHPPKNADFELSSHEGEEFIYVLSGVLEIIHGKQTYRLEAGDSIYYDSIVPHHVHSAMDTETKILAVVYAPH
ncbi:MAG: cupin domain-containing protein [Lentisphaeria bacterium]|nr:cupin domain-containing protein [Lentisphaeria bacterium]